MWCCCAVHAEEQFRLCEHEADVQFDLRNGAIRKKYDSLKYTLRKMENTLYELSLAEAGFKKQEDPEGVRL